MYAFPMVMGYGYPANVFTPTDTAVVTPNSETPYSFVEMDLWAEPMVLTVPAAEKGRYYSIQLVDLYTFDYDYIGSRATGNGAGSLMIAGRTRKGETPPGIKKVSWRCGSTRPGFCATVWKPPAVQRTE